MQIKDFKKLLFINNSNRNMQIFNLQNQIIDNISNIFHEQYANIQSQMHAV